MSRWQQQAQRLQRRVAMLEATTCKQQRGALGQHTTRTSAQEPPQSARRPQQRSVPPQQPSCRTASSTVGAGGFRPDESAAEAALHALQRVHRQTSSALAAAQVVITHNVGTFYVQIV